MGLVRKKKEKAVAPEPKPVEQTWQEPQPTGFVGPNQEPLAQPEPVAQPVEPKQVAKPEQVEPQEMIIGKELINGQLVWKIVTNGHNLGAVGDIL